MENYDEDLSDNIFFQILLSQHEELCIKAAKNDWIVCVPRAGSLPKYAFTEENLQTHILYNLKEDEEEESNHFRTLNNKDVKIDRNVITTGVSFSQPSTIHILFEETYYLDSTNHFRAFCLESPLNGSTGPSISSERVVCLHSLKDCVDFLWTETGGQKITEQIDQLIHPFNARFLTFEAESLQQLKDAVHSLYASAMQILLKNPRVRKKQFLMDNFKLSVETFVLHGVYDVLMRAITACLGYQDSKLNKNMRNLSDLQLKDLNVRQEFFNSIPIARREISRLQSYTTPLGKLGCLKRTVASLSCDAKVALNNEKPIMLSTDDLLPIFIFLVIKASIPNWLAQLMYMKYFKFSTSITYDYDEYGFYQTSLEAAIEHIKSGALFGTNSPESMMGNSSISIFESSKEVIGGNAIVDKFFEAVRTGNEVDVLKYLEYKPEVNYEHSITLCHPLCSCDKCEQLQRQGNWDKPSPLTRDDRGYTALHLASIYGHTSVLEVLLENEINVNVADYRGLTSLHLASLRGHHNAVLLLLHFHADWNVVDNDGNTSLHHACANGHKDVVNALLYFTSQKVLPMPICLNASNDSGDTALHLASRWGYENIIKILIEHGAVVEILNRRRMTALDCAHNNHIKKLLVTAIENEHERINIGFIPVEITEPIGINISPTLSQSFLDPEFAVEAPEFIASASQDPVQTVLERTDKLLVAISNGDIMLSRFYLGWDQCQESDSEDENEFESLEMESHSPSNFCHPLCQCKKCIVLARQISASKPTDLNVNSANSDGFTPLHVAVMQGRSEMTELFLKNGAKLNNVTKYHKTAPIHFACQKNNTDILKILLSNGAKVNIKDRYENTPLHYCCINSYVQCARLLLENKAAVNLMNCRGNTPLHEASKTNCENLVHLLLKYNAERNIPNCHNLLPFHVAVNKEMKQILTPQFTFKDSSSLVITSRHPMVEYHTPHHSAEEKVKMLSFGQPPIATGVIRHHIRNGCLTECARSPQN